MARVIAVANQKGGVGKTTTSSSLGAALAERGRRTLLVDLDPQAALTAGFGIDAYALQKTIYDTLVRGNEVPVTSVMYNIRPNLDIVPANIDLAAAEIELVVMLGREFVLKEALEPVLDSYDYVIIDTPPSLGLLTVNALVVTNELIVPLQCEFLAMRGVRVLLDTIWKVKRKLNPNLDLLGILPTMYNSRTTHNQEVLSEVRSIFGDKVFDIVINNSVRFAEAPVAHKTILEYERNHPGAKAYRALAEVVDDKK
ncbi:MAG TPA: AAA family ATPase [Anaerolineae bacterium]|nr:AAA family ATPase [Anaerolineae bacterium]